MSTLQEELRERHGIDPRRFLHAPAGATSSSKSLAVESSHKRSWHFPWTCLVRVEYDGNGSEERLCLVFGNQEIVLKGKRLECLLPEISGLHLAVLREAPPDTEDTGADRTPFVREIVVRKLEGGGASGANSS